VVNKHLLPIYNKPMIYYPLSTLLMAGIRDILLITSPRDRVAFESLLGDGEQFGCKLHYAIQTAPRGIAEGLLIAKEFLDGHASVLIFGDNLFFGESFEETFQRALTQSDGATLFVKGVEDPRHYGVVEINELGEPIAIEEKPESPRSRLAVMGVYLFDQDAPERAERLTPSSRGELEITDLCRQYLEEGLCRLEVIGSDSTWLDTGTYDRLLEAQILISHEETVRGKPIGCPYAAAQIGRMRSYRTNVSNLARISNANISAQKGL
jgi:glucose-1-phosphate thymidylyltransferase